MSCSVCEKHKTLAGLPGGRIIESESLFAAHFPFGNAFPHFGHVIVELRRHIERPSLMSEEEARELGHWMQKISAALESELGAEHVYIFRIGDKTAHLHFHLVPRFPGTPKEAWGTGLYESPHGRKATPEEAVAITVALRKRLS